MKYGNIDKMSWQTKKLFVVIGLIFGISGVLLSFPAAINGNYLLFGICLFLVITGVIMFAMGVD